MRDTGAVMSLEATKRIAGSAALAAVAVVGLAVWFVFDRLASTLPPAQLIANPGDTHVTLRWHIDAGGADIARWEPVHRLMLSATVETLAECATPGNPVRIRPYGFASSAPFAGRDDSDELNVRAANGRARKVHEELRRLSRGRVPEVRVEEPPEWDTFDEMVAERNACIPSPSRERDRDSFLDRAVVLTLLDPGSCAAERLIGCRTSDTAGPRRARAAPPVRQVGWLTGAGRADGTGG